MSMDSNCVYLVAPMVGPKLEWCAHHLFALFFGKKFFCYSHSLIVTMFQRKAFVCYCKVFKMSLRRSAVPNVTVSASLWVHCNRVGSEPEAES